MPQLIWLVTGCSSGIGESFVYEILSRGDKVIASSRGTSSRLAHLQVGAKILAIDINTPQVKLDQKIEEATGFYGGINVLVNNAGFFDWNVIEETSSEGWLAILNTNLLGTINLTRSILPHFREKEEGKIVFVSSVDGWEGYAGGSVYSMSKFALEGYVESLQGETSPFGIQSIIFEPGQFRTPVLASSYKKTNVSRHPDYEKLAAEVDALLKASDGKQKGDPRKGAGRMIDVVNSEGRAAGRPMPKRLPLGKDSLKTIREKCKETLRLCDEWEEIIVSTSRDED